MKDYILCQTPEYEVRGEFLWFGVVLHCDVKVRWTRSVKSRFRQDLLNIISSLNGPVYAFQTPSHDPLKLKFIQSIGGVLHHRRLTQKGELAQMFIFRPLD